MERAIFAVHFLCSFCSIPIGWKGSTNNSQCHNCYPDAEEHKRHPFMPVGGRSVARSIVQKDAVQYCPWNWWAYPSHVISASTCCSCQPSISLQEWLTTVRCGLRSGKSLHVTICVKKSLGSRTRHRFVFVTYLLNRCHYCTSTWDRPWHDVGGWLVVTKADCDLGL